MLWFVYFESFPARWIETNTSCNITHSLNNWCYVSHTLIPLTRKIHATRRQPIESRRNNLGRMHVIHCRIASLLLQDPRGVTLMNLHQRQFQSQPAGTNASHFSWRKREDHRTTLWWWHITLPFLYLHSGTHRSLMGSLMSFGLIIIPIHSYHCNPCCASIFPQWCLEHADARQNPKPLEGECAYSWKTGRIESARFGLDEIVWQSDLILCMRLPCHSHNALWVPVDPESRCCCTFAECTPWLSKDTECSLHFNACLGCTCGVQVAGSHSIHEDAITNSPILRLAKINGYTWSSICTPTLHWNFLHVIIFSYSYLLFFHNRLLCFRGSWSGSANRLDEIWQITFEEMRHRLDDVQQVLLILALLLILAWEGNGDENVFAALKVKQVKTICSCTDIQCAW